MARLLGPDAGSRLVYVLSGGYIRSAAGRTVTMYTDAAGTVLASLATYDGTGTPGAIIAGSTVTVDSNSLLPRFWFPDGVDTIYAKVNPSGPISPINADYDARLDAATSAAASATVVAETSYGLSSSAGVAADFSRGDHTHGSPALPTPSAIGANTRLIVRRSRLTTGDIAVPNTAGVFTLVANTTLAIPAVVGDYIEFNFDQMHNLTGSNYQDWCVVVGGSIVRAASSNTATPATEGQVALYPGAASFSTAAGPFAFVAVSGDISGGNITFQLAVKTTGVGTIYRSSTYAMTLTARNYGSVNFA